MRTLNTNSLAATGQLLKLSGIVYDSQSLKDDLLGHPDYPSLFAVHDVLNQYGVQNSPVEVVAESLDEVPQPFLAYMSLPQTGNDFAVVNKVQNGSVIYTNKQGKYETITRKDFFAKWKNIAVMVDGVAKLEPATQAAKVTKPLNVKLFAATAFSLLIVVATINAANSLIFGPWLLLKSGGLAVTVLLLMYEADRQNETVKQFCSAGKTVNCDAVLQSKGAKLGPFSWSELGFAYFSGTFLYLLFTMGTATTAVPLALLSLLALPYTIYSVYYQYKIVRQWCRLCLFIQGIFVVEALFALFTVVLPNNWQLTAASWQPGLMLIPLLVLPLLIWLALKPAFKKAANFDTYKYGYLRLQNDPDVFKAMLRRQKQAPPGYEDCSLLIGKPAAKIEIIKVCNPYCGPCVKAHPLLEEIVAQNPDVKLRILFTGTNNEKDYIGETARHFINLYLQNGPEAAEAAMHYWYMSKEKVKEDLFKKYPINDNPKSMEIKERMNAWQDEAEVTHTPTIYVNGYRLPQMYRVEDLKKIL